MLSKSKLLGAIVAIIIVIFAICAWLLLTTERERKEFIIYTFEDYVNNSAWEGVAIEEKPIFLPENYMNKPFEVKGYNATRASDNELELTSSKDCEKQEGYPYQLFRFKITKENIKALSVRWEGFGKYFLGIPNGITLYIWNPKQSNWIEIGNYSNRSNDQVITNSFINPSYLITRENFAYILAYCKIYGKGRSSSELATDYIELKVEL